MSTVEVAGVDGCDGPLDRRRRVASSSRFAVHSPIDGAQLAEVSAGGAADVAAAVDAARRAFPAWARLGPEGRAPSSAASRRRIRSRAEELAAVETADNGSLLLGNVHRVVPRAALNIEFFADWALQARARDRRTRGHESRALRARRRRRARHAVERAADAHDLEGRSGAGRRQHRGREAAGMGAAHLLAARRHRACRGHSRRRAERGAGHRRGRRRSAGRARRTSTGSASPARPRPGA